MTAPIADPRWKSLIAKSIADNIKSDKSVLYYALSTLASSTGFPQVRYVVHRGFVNEQRADTPAGVEPVSDKFATGTSLLTTTDVRAPKAQQIRDAGVQGAKAQIAWWHEGSQLQFRISGTLHIVPAAGHPTSAEPLPFHVAPPSLSSSSSSFDWAAERMRIWGKLSPSLLASFARPTPGSEHPQGTVEGEGPGEGEGKGKGSPWPLELPKPDDKDATDEQKKLLKEAEQNFALVVLSPSRVDIVDLERDRRSVFERTQVATPEGQHEEWKETRVVP